MVPHHSSPRYRGPKLNVVHTLVGVIKLVPHGWNTAVGLAADLQLASALARTDQVEYKTGSAYIDELVTSRWL